MEKIKRCLVEILLVPVVCLVFYSILLVYSLMMIPYLFSVRVIRDMNANMQKANGYTPTQAGK